MSSIESIDKNFVVESSVERDGLTFHDVKSSPFRIYGVYHDGVQYRRLPKEVAEATNPGVVTLSTHTAGGRVRFITDSPYIVIKAMLKPRRMNHMALTGSTGFDMYVRVDGEEIYKKTFIPTFTLPDCYDGVYDFPNKEERLITINFPLYNDVSEFYIGLSNDSKILPPPEYTVNKPIVYYGSSITQGGCASRPGTCYQGFISRKYDADYINLGFSGNGRGEQSMAEYIAGLDMSVFVLDFDFNATDADHLMEVHEPFFKTVREKNPDLPIVMMSAPKAPPYLSASLLRRRDIIKTTYENALAAGDKNVYFIPGNELMELAGNEGTVDTTHPTDLGFFSMAKRLEKELDKIFAK